MSIRDGTIIGATELAQRLAKWRKKSGLSRDAAARLIGVNGRTYSRWEQGRTVQPNGVMMARIEEILAQGGRAILTGAVERPGE